MASPAQPSAPPEDARRRNRDGRCPPWFTRGTVVVLVSLPFLYVLENWRGERALARAVARLQAAGETLDFSRLWPPTPLREENFCATPALDGIAGMVGDDREAGEPGAQRARLMILPFGFPEAERDIGLFKQTFSPIDWE